VAAAILAVAVVVPLWAAVLVEVGDTLPGFSALDQDNQPFRLSDQQGKVVLLHLCAGWCLPCRQSAAEEPALVAALDAEIGANNWILIDALIEDFNGQFSSAVSATQWRTLLGTPARTIHLGGDSASELGQLVFTTIGLQAFPTYLVISPDGKISFIQEGWLGNDPLHDAVVAAWHAHQSPATQLQGLLDQLGDSGIERAIGAKLNAAYALLTDDDPDNDHAVANILRAVLRQIDAQAGNALGAEEAAALAAIVQQIAGALQGT
jgi:thiol-disulfide isomerase/thioredoxin